jgi:hypothetical protein
MASALPAGSSSSRVSAVWRMPSAICCRMDRYGSRTSGITARTSAAQTVQAKPASRAKTNR